MVDEIDSPQRPTGEREDTDIRELVDRLFRHQAGQVIVTLMHIFGLQHLDWSRMCCWKR